MGRITRQKLAEILRMKAEGKTDARTAIEAGVGVATVWRATSGSLLRSIEAREIAAAEAKERAASHGYCGRKYPQNEIAAFKNASHFRPVHIQMLTGYVPREAAS